MFSWSCVCTIHPHAVKLAVDVFAGSGFGRGQGSSRLGEGGRGLEFFDCNKLVCWLHLFCGACFAVEIN